MRLTSSGSLIPCRATMTVVVCSEVSRKRSLRPLMPGGGKRSQCHVPLIAITYFDWRGAVEFQRLQARSLDRDQGVIRGRRAGEVPA